jgi:hypothetical protein
MRLIIEVLEIDAPLAEEYDRQAQHERIPTILETEGLAAAYSLVPAAADAQNLRVHCLFAPHDSVGSPSPWPPPNGSARASRVFWGAYRLNLPGEYDIYDRV